MDLLTVAFNSAVENRTDSEIVDILRKLVWLIPHDLPMDKYKLLVKAMLEAVTDEIVLIREMEADEVLFTDTVKSFAEHAMLNLKASLTDIIEQDIP